MLAGDWAHILAKLNKRLHVWCSNDGKKHAGIYYLSDAGEYEHLYATEKNWVPEGSHYDSMGHLVKSGTHRIVKNLLSSKLTTPEKVKKYYKKGFFEMRGDPFTMDPKPINLKDGIADMQMESQLTGAVDERKVNELHHELTKHETHWDKDRRNRRRFELNQALGKDREKIYV
jgi:hypothetical protein